MGGCLLLCFVGVDGSGKTTHAKCIASFLRKKGYSCRYVKIVSRPILLYFFLMFTRIAGYWESNKKGVWMDPLKKASPTLRMKLGKIYRLLLFVDFLIIVLVKVILLSYFTKVLVLDRYVYDLIMELKLSSLSSNNFDKLILTLTPIPRKVFLADATLELLAQRRPDICIDNLFRKQVFYRNLAKFFGFQTFDTSISFEINQQFLQKEALLAIKGIS